MLCVSVGAWAELTVTVNDKETHNGVTATTYTVNVGAAGDLAALINSHAGAAQTVYEQLTKWGTYYHFTGTMNSEDIEALSAICSDYASSHNDQISFDLSGVQLADGAGFQAFNNDKVAYVLFPSGLTTTQLASIASNCDNLKTCGAVNTTENVTLPKTLTSANEDGEWVVEETYATFNEMAVFSKEQNHVHEFAESFTLTDATLNKFSMAGNCGDKDLSFDGTQRNFNSIDLHYFDFTGATFDPLTIEITSNNAYGVTVDEYGNINESVAKISGEQETNAFYHINKYNVFTCTLPTGNDEIPPMAFMTNNGGWSSPISEITIPTGYKKIGFEAFQGAHIANLKLPSTMESVGEGSFSSCPILENVEMEGLTSPNGCTFGHGTFGSCKQLKFITLSEGVKNIADKMFYQCLLLENVRIPNSCEVIGKYAFEECYTLHTLTIPEGVKLVDYNAFKLTGIADLYIMATSPDKVPGIYSLGCSNNDVGPATFDSQRINGNGTSPENRAEASDVPNLHYDEVCAFYQEYQSGEKGLGTSNCLINIHYPDNMKLFYEGVNLADMQAAYGTDVMASIPGACDKTDWIEYLNSHWSYGLIKEKKLGTDLEGDLEKYMPALYSIRPQSYDKLMGPDADGLYYPTSWDYYMRLAAGSQNGTSRGNVASAWGWRQFPLAASIGDMGEEEFTKEYDDTWYTMCFPWKMTDNQLFDAFNQKCEIVEFKGAEMIKQDATNFNLIFHFDDVAATYYMDNDDVEYSRVLDEGRFDKVGNKVYIYTPVDGGSSVSYPEFQGNISNASAEVKAAYAKYNSIQNVMVIAGHPYMIHPANGASAGNPTTVHITGVKKVEVGEDKTYVSYESMAEANKVNKTVAEINSAGGVVADTWKTPSGEVGGSYTFIGNINDEVIPEGAVEGDKGVQDMPLPCYFLGVKSGTVYPQYFRKKSGGKGKWSQYSAIIVPDQAAIENIENNMVTSGGSSSSAKAVDITFGEWEIVDENQMTTVINNAVEEAQEKNQTANIQHLNVVYNIKGQIIRSGSSSVEGLPKGLYIVNGKKYMVR